MNRTKRRIFNTAIKLFSEKGYDNTSVEEITAVSGVAKGSLYYHFAKKEDIFDLLLEEGMRLLENSIEIKTRKCNTALDKIKAVMLVQIKVTVKYEDLINIIFSQLWGQDSKNIKCKNEIFQYINIVSKIVEDGINNNEFYECDIEALASGIVGVTCSSLLYRLKTKKDVQIEEIYNEFTSTIIRGIVKK